MHTNSYEDNYLTLVNKKVIGLVKDDEDGTIAWILCDPEGNGPGFLAITE